VQALTKASKSFAKIRFSAFGVTSTVGVEATEVDTSREAEFDIARTGSPASAFISNIILQSSIWINVKFDRLYQASEASIILSSVIVISVVLGVINMLFRPIYAQPVFRNLKFFCSIAKRQKT
jgi:ABC-type glucose/galactose transport system permease subunit